MLRPPRSTRPVARASGTVSCSRFRQRRKVDLPQPDGPMIAVTSRSSSVTDTSRIPADAPKNADRLSASRRARPRAGLRCSVARAGADSGPGCEAGCDTDDEDEGKEDEGARPREPAPVVVRADGIGKDLQGHRGDRLVETYRPERVAKGGENQRRGLAGNARDGHEHAGHDSRG